MLKDKKGVELSLNMVIMTIIGLLVLMVLAFLVYKAVNNNDTATGCANNGGVCSATGSPCPGDSMLLPFSCGKNEKCCTISEDESGTP